MSCNDFCTAAKCEELENRISALEQALELIQASFTAHTNQDIVEGHNYQEPEVQVSLATSQNQELKVFVAVGSKNDSETITLPEPEVQVSLAASQDQELKVFVAVGSKNDSETITLPSPNLVLNADIYDGTLLIDLTINDRNDRATVDLPKPEQFDLNNWLDLLKELFKAYLLNEFKDALQDLIKDAIDKLIEELIQNIFNLVRDYIDDLLPRGGGGGGGGSSHDHTQDFLTGNGYLTAEGILDINISSSIGNADIQINMGLNEIEKLLKEVHEYTVIDIKGQTPTKFLCQSVESNSPQANKPHTALTYTGKGITGLHELTKTFNDNLLTVFTEVCQKEVIAAIPEWWQVRLGASRPQIVCTFRRGATRTYHSLSIPHPKESTKPTDALIPEYQKGNWQGMIVLNDNSKFIINCVSSDEAERICSIAASLISSAFLPNPLKIWITERKGEPVKSDLMIPTTIMYYPTGQKNTNPEWRFAIPPDLEPI